MANAVTCKRLTPYLKQRIVTLNELGTKQTEIVQTILHEENVKVSRKTVNLTIQRSKHVGELKPRKQGCRPTKLNDDHLAFLSHCLTENCELSGHELAMKLKCVFGVSVSTSTVKQARRKLGWISSTPSYCQTVRHVNRPKRFDYAVRCVQTDEKFEDVIFTDESTIKIPNTANKCFYKLGEDKPLKGKPKHPFQVHVWAGISRKGPTDIHIFSGIMDSVYYQEILSTYFIPFVQTHYPEHHRLMQDNDPKHVSKSTKDYMQRNNINHWPTPPESPDLNPIENVWAGMKRYLRKTKKPKNKEELVEGIKYYWYTKVTPAVCNRYINHLFNVIPVVIKKHGDASGK